LKSTIELRIGEPLALGPEVMEQMEWNDAANKIEEQVRQALAHREEKLLGKDGQITRDISSALERFPDAGDQTRITLLGLVSQGTTMGFDARTHRQVRQVFIRLRYAYLAGDMLMKADPQSLEEDVLKHLQGAQEAQRRSWGESERMRLGESASSVPVEELGHQVQNQIYRQVLLGAITELWVDYLTRVEALRVSIGLEAYAQADPLVKYKSQASQMFQNLLSDIRSVVISRVFLIQPRGAAGRVETEQSASPQPQAAAAPAANTDKKRKRHRH